MNEIDMLRNDKLIREKDLGNGISSFNFSNKCFYDKLWTKEAVKARGLFCDVENNKVVARSYNKFFNIEERPETEMRNLRRNLVFPVDAYIKYNGFLAMISADKDDSEKLFIASKSTNQGTYAGYIKNIVDATWNEDTQRMLADELNTMNITAVFECIDPVNDPHIVEYERPMLILLDCVSNEFEYYHMEYGYVRCLAERFHIQCKSRVEVLNNWEQFEKFIKTYENVCYMEGFVFEDANGFMVKYKTPWYRYWKQARGVLQQVWNGRDINSINNIDNKIDKYLKRYIPDFVFFRKNTYDACPSVIELRREFLNYMSNMPEYIHYHH